MIAASTLSDQTKIDLSSILEIIDQRIHEVMASDPELSAEFNQLDRLRGQLASALGR